MPFADRLPDSGEDLVHLFRIVHQTLQLNGVHAVEGIIVGTARQSTAGKIGERVGAKFIARLTRPRFGCRFDLSGRLVLGRQRDRPSFELDALDGCGEAIGIRLFLPSRQRAQKLVLGGDPIDRRRISGDRARVRLGAVLISITRAIA